MNTYQQMAILLSQTPNLQKIQVVSQDAPAQQQSFLSAMAAERHRRNRQQVQQVEKSEGRIFIQEEEGKKDPHQGEQKPRQKKKEPEEETTADDPNVDPEVGNILNLEV